MNGSSFQTGSNQLVVSSPSISKVAPKVQEGLEIPEGRKTLVPGASAAGGSPVGQTGTAGTAGTAV